MTTYTVFAVYEGTCQPYATTVEADDPDAAIVAAQRQAIEDNGGDEDDYDFKLDHSNGYIELEGGGGDLQLAGFQVVEGEVMVVA